MNNNHERAPLSSHLDYYKITMGNVIHEYHPDDEVTFTFKNRALEYPLAQYVDPAELQDRLDDIRERGFSAKEIAYYAGLQASDGTARFSEDYLNSLETLQLPKVEVVYDDEIQDLAIKSTDKWLNVTFWETVIMSEINEIYYTNLVEQNGMSMTDIYREGDARLDAKIATLRANPSIKFADFGTRRRFSATWHEHVIRRLKAEAPEQFIGTSNPWFAYKYDLAPIGTFAHEMPMVYAGISDQEGSNPLAGHNQMLQDWDNTYHGDLSSALTDTFGSEFFFGDMTKDQAEGWTGLRHDSGDPIEFGERAIRFYEDYGIDAHTKTIVFSDGLNIDKIVELNNYFEGRINVVFGWGTSLMNDLGIRANNMVMKATAVNDTPTVKLSDDKGKHTGPDYKVEEYQKLVTEAINYAVA